MNDLIFISPSDRDLTFGGNLIVDCVQKQSARYLINGRLHRKLEVCPHCGYKPVSLSGSYNFSVADLPYVDSVNRVMPVRFSIKAPRFVCGECKKISVEPRPPPLNPVVTQSMLTLRMSEWLISELQTPMTYEVLARTAGQSTVWIRKWYADVRKEMNLPPKRARKGPRPKDLPLIFSRPDSYQAIMIAS